MQQTEPCNTLALFHNDAFKEHDVDVEVQMTVKGSYEQSTAVNQAVAAWVQDNDYKFGGMMFCIYHVSPHETQNPDEYVTVVCYSVKKK